MCQIRRQYNFILGLRIIVRTVVWVAPVIDSFARLLCENRASQQCFAARAQDLPLPELTAALEQSIAYLTGES